MKKTVIIGASDIGLSWALMLHKKGVRNIVIVDKQAGEYLRHDPIAADTFDRINRYLGHKKAYRIKPSSYQLREFEQGLYDNALQLGIPIIKKSFKSFISDGEHKGVVVTDDHGDEEKLEADFVFDATGEKRSVMYAIREASRDLHINEISCVKKILTPTYIAASINVPTDKLLDVTQTPAGVFSSLQCKSDKEELALKLKLRKFGWERFILPAFRLEVSHQNEASGLSEVFCYMESPPNLAKERQSEWAQLLLSIYSDGRINTFNPVSANSPKEATTNVRQQYLRPSMFEYFKGYQGSKQFPTVIPIGEAIISRAEPLTCGLQSELKYLSFLLEKTTVKHKAIDNIDQIGYSMAAYQRVRAHKKNLQAVLGKGRFDVECRNLRRLHMQFKKALSSPEWSHEAKTTLSQMINEIESYASLINAQRKFDKAKEIAATAALATSKPGLFQRPEAIRAICDKQIVSLLQAAREHLPATFIDEKRQLQRLLEALELSPTRAAVSYV